MRLAYSATLLGLAWFAAVNLLLSACAWLAARRLARHGATAGADALLCFRLLPAAASTLFVTVVFLPAHLRFEPAEPDESFGAVLLLLACAGLALVCRSLWRVSRVAAAATRLGQALRAREIGVAGDVCEVPDFGGVSLAGVIRTRVLVGADVGRTLTSEELTAVVAHEHAHRDAWDNLKRCAMFCAPDFFGWSAAARTLEEAWRGAAECLADTQAAAGDERRAVHLASALVKVARLGAARRGPLASPVWSTFHEPLLESRVRRLVKGAPPLPRRRATWMTFALALGAIAIVVVAYATTAHALHEVTEAFIRATF